MGEADRTKHVKDCKEKGIEASPLFWGTATRNTYVTLKENHERYIKSTTNLSFQGQR
jgi:hypothetical protein